MYIVEYANKFGDPQTQKERVKDASIIRVFNQFVKSNELTPLISYKSIKIVIIYLKILKIKKLYSTFISTITFPINLTL